MGDILAHQALVFGRASAIWRHEATVPRNVLGLHQRRLQRLDACCSCEIGTRYRERVAGAFANRTVWMDRNPRIGLLEDSLQFFNGWTLLRRFVQSDDTSCGFVSVGHGAAFSITKLQGSPHPSMTRPSAVLTSVQGTRGPPEKEV